jgi:hypothetical protein
MSILSIGLVPEKMIQITTTWVIPSEGHPIEAHKLLDGVTVDVGKQWQIPSGEWKGYSK